LTSTPRTYEALFVWYEALFDRYETLLQEPYEETTVSKHPQDLGSKHPQNLRIGLALVHVDQQHPSTSERCGGEFGDALWRFLKLHLRGKLPLQYIPTFLIQNTLHSTLVWSIGFYVHKGTLF
jgi:hypothetical protein